MLIPLKSVRSPEVQRTFSAPIITTILIILNVAAFVFQLLYGIKNSPGNYGIISRLYLGIHASANTYGAIPYELILFKDIPPLSKYPVHISLLTSLFLHGGFLHIIGNMLYLNAFGPNVENKMGYFKFLLFYLICGIGATLCYIVPYMVPIFRNEIFSETIKSFGARAPLIGASGAIAGVMGAHFILSPSSKIKCLFLIFVVSLPAIVVLVPWILIQIDHVYRGAQSNVAWIAHVGGFIIGMLLNNKFCKKNEY